MAERPTASIVVLAWNAWQHTRTCLESLRPTLGLHDEVIVVDNGSTDATPDVLRRAGWTKVITNDENRGFAAGCNQGAAVATGEVVVFLNNDTVPVGRWLDELLAPFADETVVATGARSNFVSGPQLVPEAAYTTRSELRGFERSWRLSHTGQTEEIRRLVGFCLAVRQSAFEAVGGFDEHYGAGGYEDDDLCLRLGKAGGRLLVAHGAYVHHVGHASFDANGLDWQQIELENRGYFLRSDRNRPLVSACLIVRDEEEVVARCLDSLSQLADEVVVGDTGSTDRTAEIASRHGAIVVQVPWKDHFADARNATLAHCSGQWIVWLDADEEWMGDSTAVRQHLAGQPAVDGALVSITNNMGSGASAKTTHPAVRIFRRGLVWQGRIHEQVVRPDGRSVLAPLLDQAGIVHHGYTDRTMAARNKVERNLRLATLALDEAEGVLARSRAELDLGRTLLAAGRAAEAVPHLETAAREAPEPAASRIAIHVAVRASIAAGRLDTAAAFIAQLRKISHNPLLPDMLTAEMAFLARMHREAVELFRRLELPGLDEDNFAHRPSEVAHLVASCHRALGQPGLAVEALLEALRTDGVCQEHLGTIVHDAVLAGVDLRQIGAALPKHSIRLFLAQTLQIDPEDALAVLEGAWDRHVDDLAVLAAASSVAVGARPATALPWAARLRERGLGPCPLVAIAARQERPVTERLLAAAAAHSAFTDQEATRILASLVPTVGLEWIHQAREILTALAPAYLCQLPSAPQGRVAIRPRAYLASIVIPCWNRAAWTLRCLQSLQATLQTGSYELILVDNGSSDATSRITSNPDAGVVVVRNDSNLGFAVACNQGARAATSDLLVFCNNDVVARPGWLEPLVSALSDPRVGIVGPKLLFPDGTIQHAGVALLHDSDGEGYLDGFHLLYRQPGGHPAAARASEMRAVTGAVMATRRGSFLQLGGFDEGYWNGNEDVDLCLKFGQAGWLVRYEPASVLIHQESASGTERFREVTRNRARLTIRWSRQLIDERVDGGVAVAAPFGRGDRADAAGRALTVLAEEAGLPVVTRSWAGPIPCDRPPIAGGTWEHRLGPPQLLVLSPLEGEELSTWMEADSEWVPENAKVLAGTGVLSAAGLLTATGESEATLTPSPGAAEVLQDLSGGTKRPTHSSWRATRADQERDPRTGHRT